MVFVCDTCYEEKGVAREASSVFLVDARYDASTNPFEAIPMCEQHEGGFTGTDGKLSVLQAYAILDADTPDPVKDALPPEWR
jgi:hypothetical protein